MTMSNLIHKNVAGFIIKLKVHRHDDERISCYVIAKDGTVDITRIETYRDLLKLMSVMNFRICDVENRSETLDSKPALIQYVTFIPRKTYPRDSYLARFLIGSKRGNADVSQDFYVISPNGEKIDIDVHLIQSIFDYLQKVGFEMVDIEKTKGNGFSPMQLRTKLTMELKPCERNHLMKGTLV